MFMVAKSKNTGTSVKSRLALAKHDVVDSLHPPISYVLIISLSLARRTITP